MTDTLLEHEIDLREAPGLSGRLLNGRRYPTTSAVIPTLNEERNIGHVLEDMPDCVTQVVLVDGLSTDRTIEVAREVRPDLRLVMETKRGKGAALAAGFRAATCDVIVMLDADGSTQPQEIPRFLDALVAGADFVKGSRFADGGGSSDITPLRRAGNKSFAHVVNFLWGTDFGDLCYGYNAFWRDCLEHVVIDSAGFEVETLLAIRAARAGLRIDEVPSYESPRMFGESNLRTFPDGVRVLRTILAERIRP